jgi:hypothetical protein
LRRNICRSGPIVLQNSTRSRSRIKISNNRIGKRNFLKQYCEVAFVLEIMLLDGAGKKRFATKSAKNRRLQLSSQGHDGAGRECSKPQYATWVHGATYCEVFPAASRSHLASLFVARPILKSQMPRRGASGPASAIRPKGKT